MNKEEIEELKDFTIDLTDIDELALGLEVCSKKSNMVIQEFADTIIQLQQENKKYKEVIFKIKMIISARIKEYQKKIDNEIDMGSQGDHFKICRYEENIKFLKDILKEVE
ncbi:MAG: hypothetical protein SOZ53_06480 [Candidatus Onthovivens sp.]|nr:hypothetical protein [Candidatus Onthovivens sp.]